MRPIFVAVSFANADRVAEHVHAQVVPQLGGDRGVVAEPGMPRGDGVQERLGDEIRWIGTWR